MTAGGDFRHRAVCRDTDPELFHPATDSGVEHDRQVAAAKAVCARCPVRADCLTWALDALPYGVAGGMTDAERRRERAHRGPAPSSVRQRPEAGSQAEVAAAGRDALRSGGCSVREVAREFEVSERTAARWAVSARHGGEGSRGGNRAPLGISHTTDTQPGTRTQEGHRS